MPKLRNNCRLPERTRSYFEFGFKSWGSIPRLCSSQHNAVGERANGLLKETLGIRKRDPPWHLPIRVWQTTLDHVCHWMNTAFRRQSRGGKTPQDFHDALHTWYPALSREDFYAAARSAVEHAAKSHSDPCEPRNAERAAIIETMESFGILRRTRGRARIPIPGCEGIS